MVATEIKTFGKIRCDLCGKVICSMDENGKLSNTNPFLLFTIDGKQLAALDNSEKDKLKKFIQDAPNITWNKLYLCSGSCTINWIRSVKNQCPKLLDVSTIDIVEPVVAKDYNEDKTEEYNRLDVKHQDIYIKI